MTQAAGPNQTFLHVGFRRRARQQKITSGFTVMLNRPHFSLIIAAGFSAVDVALVTFFTLGLMSERNQPRPMTGVLVGVPAVALIVSFILTYRLTSPLSVRQTQDVKWLLLGLLSAAGGFVLAGSAYLYAVRYRWLPPSLLAQGDFDLNPLLIAICFGLLLAFAVFWPVYGRSWHTKKAIR